MYTHTYIHTYIYIYIILFIQAAKNYTHIETRTASVPQASESLNPRLQSRQSTETPNPEAPNPKPRSEWMSGLGFRV